MLMGPLRLHRQMVADLPRERHPLSCRVHVIFLRRRGLLKLGREGWGFCQYSQPSDVHGHTDTCTHITLPPNTHNTPTPPKITALLDQRTPFYYRGRGHPVTRPPPHTVGMPTIAVGDIFTPYTNASDRRSSHSLSAWKSYP